MSIIETYLKLKHQYLNLKGGFNLIPIKDVNPISISDNEKKIAEMLYTTIEKLKQDIEKHPDKLSKYALFDNLSYEQKIPYSNKILKGTIPVIKFKNLTGYVKSIFNNSNSDILVKYLIGEKYKKGLFYDINFGFHGKRGDGKLSDVYGKITPTLYVQSSEIAFNDIYLSNRWNITRKNVPSGEGSTIENTKTTRDIIKKIINENKITHIWDAACGDLTWMNIILNEIKVTYYGTDTSSVRINLTKNEHDNKKLHFFHLDMSNPNKKIFNKINKNVKNGLIICREVFQHMTTDNILKALKSFKRSNYKYLLITNHIKQPKELTKIDIFTGGTVPRNLYNSPFSLPKTETYYENVKIFSESNHDEVLQKYLSLWKIENGEIIEK